jgi:hypothetical protein
MASSYKIVILCVAFIILGAGSVSAKRVTVKVTTSWSDQSGNHETQATLDLWIDNQKTKTQANKDQVTTGLNAYLQRILLEFMGIAPVIGLPLMLNLNWLFKARTHGQQNLARDL